MNNRFFAIFLFALLTACHTNRRIPPKEGEALTRSWEIALALRSFEDDGGRISDLIGSQASGVVKMDDIISKLSLTGPYKAAINASAPASHPYLDWPEYEKPIDPWGHPYLLAWTKTTVSSSNRDKYTFFVWSYGPDGVNEFGQGDDLFSLNGQHMRWPK